MVEKLQSDFTRVVLSSTLKSHSVIFLDRNILPAALVSHDTVALVKQKYRD